MRATPLPDKENLSFIDLLRGLEQDAIDQLYKQMQYRLYRKGDMILSIGHVSQAIFLMHTGFAKICTASPVIQRDNSEENESVFHIVGPGALLGEVNFLDNSGHTASVVALETASCFMLGNEVFRESLTKYPQLEKNFHHHLGARFRRMTAMFCLVTHQNVAEGIGEQLLKLANAYGEIGETNAILIRVPLTQVLLGAMTGHSRENVGRSLAFFKSRGWIDYAADRRILIKDAYALNQYCGHSYPNT